MPFLSFLDPHLPLMRSAVAKSSLACTGIWQLQLRVWRPRPRKGRSSSSTLTHSVHTHQIWLSIGMNEKGGMVDETLTMPSVLFTWIWMPRQANGKHILIVIPQSVMCQLLLKSSDYASFPPDYHALTLKEHLVESLTNACCPIRLTPECTLKENYIPLVISLSCLSERWMQMIYPDMLLPCALHLQCRHIVNGNVFVLVCLLVPPTTTVRTPWIDLFSCLLLKARFLFHQHLTRYDLATFWMDTM